MRKFLVGAALLFAAVTLPAQQMVTETRDPAQQQDADFEKSVKEWTTQPYFISPLVDHLPVVKGIPTPKDVLGYHIGAPYKLTYYADILKYYRALAAATPRVKVETIGKSDEGRELVVVWVSSDANIKNVQKNRDNLAKIADPRGLSEAQVKQLVTTTKPHYHFMGGLHSGETGPSEMLMELCYRLATETSPLITQIRDNVIVSISPVADPDGRDRNVDWFYTGLDEQRAAAAPAFRIGANTSITTTTATLTSRSCRCAPSPIGISRRIRRSCTTCTKDCRSCTPTAAGHRRIRISIRFSSLSCPSSPTGRWRRWRSGACRACTRTRSWTAGHRATSAPLSTTTTA